MQSEWRCRGRRALQQRTRTPQQERDRWKQATVVQRTLYIDTLGAPPVQIYATDATDDDVYYLAWTPLVAGDDVRDSISALNHSTHLSDWPQRDVVTSNATEIRLFCSPICMQCVAGIELELFFFSWSCKKSTSLNYAWWGYVIPHSYVNWFTLWQSLDWSKIS